MARKTLAERRSDALSELEMAKARLAKLDNEAAERIGRIAIKSGLVNRGKDQQGELIMKTAHRISALANQLNELQACLGRASGRPSNSVMEAQRIAAELASSLEDWHLETLHIPEPERDLYRAQNPYYAAH